MEPRASKRILSAVNDRFYRGTIMKKKNVIKDLIILWIAMTALVCAALNLHISLNMLGEGEE